MAANSDIAPISSEEAPVEIKDKIPCAQHDIPSSQSNIKATSDIQDEIQPACQMLEAGKTNKVLLAQVPEFQVLHLHL